MKHIYTAFFILVSLSSSAQFQISAGYSASVPCSDLADNINLLHSFNIGSAYKVPGTGGRFLAGVDISVGSYANTTKEQTFSFSNGSTTRTDVNYTSNVFQAALTGKLMAFKNSILNPYASAKAGYASFYSNIFIEDPQDPGGCRALDQRNLISDGTFFGGYGGGLQVDWSLFGNRVLKGTHFIDISVSRNAGGHVDYINTKKLYDAGDPATSGTEVKPLNVKFINASTQEIHEHQVAQVFNSPVRMLEFKISAVMNLGEIVSCTKKSNSKRDGRSRCTGK